MKKQLLFQVLGSLVFVATYAIGLEMNEDRHIFILLAFCICFVLVALSMKAYTGDEETSMAVSDILMLIFLSGIVCALPDVVVKNMPVLAVIAALTGAGFVAHLGFSTAKRWNKNKILISVVFVLNYTLIIIPMYIFTFKQ